MPKVIKKKDRNLRLLKETNRCKIYGTNRKHKLHYAKPEWSKEEQLYFNYKGYRCYLADFMTCLGVEEFGEFDGYSSDTFFSGLLIKLIQDDYGDDCVLVYYYCR